MQGFLVAAQADEIAGMQHLQRYVGVAALVGLPESARALETQAEEKGQGHDRQERSPADKIGHGQGRHSLVGRRTGYPGGRR